jgi:hypothetical protein
VATEHEAPNKPEVMRIILTCGHHHESSENYFNSPFVAAVCPKLNHVNLKPAYFSEKGKWYALEISMSGCTPVDF